MKKRIKTVDRIITESKKLPRVRNYFPGTSLPADFKVPSSVLLYCHSFNWPETIISSRYMLIIPFVEITYQVEEFRYKLNCGKTLLVKPYLHRSVPAMHEDYLRLIISFELAGDQEYLPEFPVMKISDKAWEIIGQILEEYDRQEVVPLSFSLTLLLQELSRNTVKQADKQNSSEVKRAICYINQYLAKSFTIEEVASHVGLSSSHLRYKFRHDTGISLGQYIRDRRTGAAKSLLVETNLKIEEIAISCGYNSVYSFSRFFKQSTGLSPMQFRKQFQ